MLVYLGMTFVPFQACAHPSVPGFTVTTYATLSDPGRISFDPTGILYVGHTDAVAKVRRIGVGGTPITNYGPDLGDPDAVLFDATGTISGTAGSVLVARLDVINPGFKGRITVITPDENAVTLFTISPASSFSNPDEMVFDSTGRFLVIDGGPSDQLSVLSATSTSLGFLFDLGGGYAPRDIAIDASDQIFTVGSDGSITVHDSSGTLVDGAFASGLGAESHMAFGSGLFPGDLFVVDESGDLLQFDSLGNSTTIGIGFEPASADLVFGPDGALYISESISGRILRVAPNAVAVPGLSPWSLVILCLSLGVAVCTSSEYFGLRMAFAKRRSSVSARLNS